MRAFVEAVRELGAMTGWGRLRCALFVWEYGTEGSRIAVSALEGVRSRNGG